MLGDKEHPISEFGLVISFEAKAFQCRNGQWSMVFVRGDMRKFLGRMSDRSMTG